MKELIEQLRDIASKGVSVWGDLQMEAASTIERLENELTAATLRIENDTKIITSLRALLMDSLQSIGEYQHRDALKKMHPKKEGL